MRLNNNVSARSRGLVPNLTTSGLLSPAELARLCEGAMSARAAIFAERERATVLWNIVAELPSELPSLVARVRNKILPSGELDDRASPELALIRHEIARLRSQITRSLGNLMRRSEEAIPLEAQVQRWEEHKRSSGRTYCRFQRHLDARTYRHDPPSVIFVPVHPRTHAPFEAR